MRSRLASTRTIESSRGSYVCIAFENFDPDDVFLDLIAFARKRASDHEPEELAHPVRIGEALAAEHPLELTPDVVVGRPHRSSMNQNGALLPMRARSQPGY